MEESKTHWREFHPTDYLGAYAFEPEEEKILTIREAHHGQVKGDKGRAEDCLVIHWQEKDVKPMIINVTNSKAIAKVSGSPYIEDWVGIKVGLFSAEISAFGEVVEAVRIRQTPPKIVKPILKPTHPKWADASASIQAGTTTVENIRKHYQLSAGNAELLRGA